MPRNNQQRHTILVVDDTPLNLDVLHELLKDDYRVQLSTSGTGALDLLARTPHPPSLVLLDLMMPVLDGFETLGRIRQTDAGRDLPVIFLSAIGDTASKVKGFQLGAVDYITKPFEPEEVLARVRTHLALVDAVRLKEDVERIMRHDLKSPLNTILATAQFEVDTGDLGGSLAESLQIILDSAVAMKDMIDLSLELFKMEQGTFRLVAEEVDLNRLLDRLHRDLGPLLGAGDLGWVWEGGDPSDGVNRTLSGRDLLCFSLLGNLFRNAVEAAPRGGQITVFLGQSDEGWLEVGVRNPGEVPAALREKLFQKYATAGKISGTGLGLYSARLLAGALGAALEADLKEPGHTTFRVRFPTREPKE